MTIHWGKIHYRPAGQPKEITGCHITGEGKLQAPQELTARTMLAIRRFRAAPSLRAGGRALGMIQAVRAIVPGAFEKDGLALKLRLRQMRRSTALTTG
jgi:hypothetical protein